MGKGNGSSEKDFGQVLLGVSGQRYPKAQGFVMALS